MTSRLLRLAGSVALAALLVGGVAGCGTSQPTRFYELRLELPDNAALPAAAAVPGATAQDGSVWELAGAVALPAALDRDTLVVASGQAGLEPLAGHRWAAPLREAVPRVLLHDLQRLRGPGRVWAAPVPAGVQATQRLRVELLALQGGSDRRSLQLQAQWWWQALPAAGAADTPPRTASATLDLALADSSVDTLAAGHRLLLWRLAQQVAASASAAP